MRTVDPATLPRQPGFTGDYTKDLALLRGAMSPQTWGAMRLPDPGAPRMMRWRELAQMHDANVDAVLLWNGIAKRVDGKWTSRLDDLETVLVDFYDTECIAVARFMFLHRPGFRAGIRLVGEVVA